MKNEIILFLSQFALVFLIGFQSQNVRDNRYFGSAVCSFLLGLSQCFQWRLMPNATTVEMAVWLFAGPLAIMCAIWAHPRIFKARKGKHFLASKNRNEHREKLF